MTTELIPPGSPEFSARFRSFRTSAFRLETLQCYRNSGEDQAIAAFLRGDERTRDPLDDEWEDMIRSHVRAGRSMARVHVVVEPLTDYMRFELTWAYAPNVQAGEDVRILPVSAGHPWPAGLPPAGTDFWLFDGTDLFHQHYDETGWWLGTEQVTDPVRVARARAWRDAAVDEAVPWVDYVRRRPELIPYLPAEVLA